MEVSDTFDNDDCNSIFDDIDEDLSEEVERVIGSVVEMKDIIKGGSKSNLESIEECEIELDEDNEQCIEDLDSIEDLVLYNEGATIPIPEGDLTVDSKKKDDEPSNDISAKTEEDSDFEYSVNGSEEEIEYNAEVLDVGKQSNNEKNGKYRIPPSAPNFERNYATTPPEINQPVVSMPRMSRKDQLRLEESENSIFAAPTAPVFSGLERLEYIQTVLDTVQTRVQDLEARRAYLNDHADDLESHRIETVSPVDKRSEEIMPKVFGMKLDFVLFCQVLCIVGISISLVSFNLAERTSCIIHIVYSALFVVPLRRKSELGWRIYLGVFVILYIVYLGFSIKPLSRNFLITSPVLIGVQFMLVLWFLYNARTWYYYIYYDINYLKLKYNGV